MEKIENKHRIKYVHTTEYRGEEIAVEIKKEKRSSDTIYVWVYTPTHHKHKRNARFWKREEVQSMDEAKLLARRHITEATTNVDRHLSEEDSLADFFDSVDESVESLEGKFELIEEEFHRELDKI